MSFFSHCDVFDSKDRQLLTRNFFIEECDISFRHLYTLSLLGTIQLHHTINVSFFNGLKEKSLLSFSQSYCIDTRENEIVK